MEPSVAELWEEGPPSCEKSVLVTERDKKHSRRAEENFALAETGLDGTSSPGRKKQNRSKLIFETRQGASDGNQNQPVSLTSEAYPIPFVFRSSHAFS